MRNALIIHPNDTVAVMITHVSKGEDIIVIRDGSEYKLKAAGEIPQYHKVALKDIAAGEPVIKYDNPIGRATCDIGAGTHVHTHNIESIE